MYNEYTRLTDTVYMLGWNTVLNFSVSMNKYSDANNQSLSHREYRYTDGMGNNHISMKRTFYYYLSIENLREQEGIKRAFIKIYPEDMMLLISNLEKALSWFNDDSYSGLFVMEDNNIFLTNHDLMITQVFQLGAYITIKPTTVSGNEGEEVGVEICLSDINNVISLTLAQFAGFLYTIKNFNMFVAAQNLLNYLQRPQLGTNMTDLSNSPREERRPTITRRVGKNNVLD